MGTWTVDQVELGWVFEDLLGLGRDAFVSGVLAMCLEREGAQEGKYLEALRFSFPLQLTALVRVPQEVMGLSPFVVTGTPASWSIVAGPSGAGGLAHSPLEEAGDLDEETVLAYLREVSRELLEGDLEVAVPELAWVGSTYEAWRQAVAFVDEGEEGTRLELAATGELEEGVGWRVEARMGGEGSPTESEQSEEVAEALFGPLWRLRERAEVVEAGGWSQAVGEVVLGAEFEEPAEVLTYPLLERLGRLEQNQMAAAARLTRKQQQWVERSQEERQAYLKQWRDERDLSQQEAGALVNRSVRTWQSWELGKRAPSDWLGLQLALLDLKRGD